MTEIKEKGQITNVPHQESSLVYAAFDLGFNDATSVWFFQVIPGGAIHIIDYYSNDGEGPLHYIADLKSRRYNYGDIFLPGIILTDLHNV